jgi:hypothetical protein
MYPHDTPAGVPRTQVAQVPPNFGSEVCRIVFGAEIFWGNSSPLGAIRSSKMRQSRYLLDSSILVLISVFFHQQSCASALSGSTTASILPNTLPNRHRAHTPREGFVAPYSILHKILGPGSTCNVAARPRINVQPHKVVRPRYRSTGIGPKMSGYIGPIGPLSPFRSEFFSSSTLDRLGTQEKILLWHSHLFLECIVCRITSEMKRNLISGCVCAVKCQR